MYRIKPMPLTGGFIPLARLRGRVNMLNGTDGEAREQDGGFDFPSFALPPLSDSTMRQTRSKPAPIDLRLHMDLRDVKLSVDVIVDMLLQSLDGRPFAGFNSQQSGLSRQFAANPEARRVLEKLLGQAGTLKANENISTEEIIQRLLREAHASQDESSAPLALPLKLKHFAVTHRSPSNQSRTTRRERLVHEARKLVLAQMRLLGYKAEVVTKQKDSDSALRVAVVHPEPVYTETAAHPAKQEQDVSGERAAQQQPVISEKSGRKTGAYHPAEKNFKAARTEYLSDYRHAPAQASIKLAEQLVDAKTLSRLSGEAVSSLNRMLEQGKLVPVKGETENAQRTGVSDNVMTYASLYSNKDTRDRQPKHTITIKNLYYTDQTTGMKNIRIPELQSLDLRHAGFGRSIGEILNNRIVRQRRIAADHPGIQNYVRLREHGHADGSAMFFAETPVSAATAQMEAQRQVQRQTQPEYAPPDTAKLKKELAEQAGRQLDDIIRKRLDVNKLTDKIYRNLEDRLRSERIRRGIV